MKFHIAVLAVVAVAASACSRAGVDDRAFQWSSDIPAGAVVHLRSGAGSIEVRPATGQSISVNGSRRWNRGRASDVHFVVNHSGSDYYVCAMWRNSGNCGASGYRGRNTGGFLAMFSLFHRTTDATADFVAEIPANVMIDAKTSNGSVKIDGMAAGVTALTSNGDVKAMNVAGPLRLSTSNGDIRLSSDAISATDSINVSTKNGSIEAEFPREHRGQLRPVRRQRVACGATSRWPRRATGRVGQHLQGQIGQSPRLVKMRSLNGSVVVTSRGAAGRTALDRAVALAPLGRGIYSKTFPSELGLIMGFSYAPAVQVRSGTERATLVERTYGLVFLSVIVTVLGSAFAMTQPAVMQGGHAASVHHVPLHVHSADHGAARRAGFSEEPDPHVPVHVRSRDLDRAVPALRQPEPAGRRWPGRGADVGRVRRAVALRGVQPS